MNKSLLALLAALCWASGANAQKGALKIRIIDDQHLHLPGASVQIPAANYFGSTGNDGELLVIGLEPVEYTIQISYIGYAPLMAKAVVQKNTVSEYQFTVHPGANTQQEVLVIGDRLRGQSKALNQQKNSDHITNIISADQVGRFPDANIGDAIKRVPGITMQNDQGEARNIVIRGMGPEFNAVTLNGERIPSAEGDNRRVQMDLIPSDMVQTVEVNKTLTADMDADAIGGSVNLVTRAAPEKLRLSGTLAGGFQPIRDGFIGTAALIAGTRLFHNRLGIIVNGSYNSNKYGSDNLESVWLKDGNGKLFVGDHDVRVYDEFRVRRSASASLDFRISPLHTLFLTGTYNWRDDRENRFRLRHRYRGDEEDYASDLKYGADGHITGYSNGEVLRQTKGGLNNGRNEGRRLEDQRVRSLAIRGEDVFGSLTVNWSVQYAKASEKRPNERYIALGKRDIDITQDISDAKLPLLTDATALGDYTRLDELTEQFQDQHERDINAKLNFDLPLNLIPNQKGSLLFGARIRAKEKERNNSFYSYEPNGDNADNYENIGQFPLIDRTSTGFYPGSKYLAGKFITPSFLGGLNLKDKNQFDETDEPSEYLAGNYTAKETITAGYVSLKQRLTSKLLVNAGLRLESTQIDYTGNIVEEEETLKGTASLKNQYTDVLPSINAVYRFSSSLMLKAAWTNSLARPRYYALVPYFNVNVNDQELSAGNPALKPVRSSNFDLMLEKYFSSIGLVSAGAFYKKIDQFFYTYRNDNFTRENFAEVFKDVANPIGADERWDFSQQRNGAGADLLGAELAIQRQLDFLPGFWKGFGIYLNYTYTYSKADGIYDPSNGKLIRSNVKLPGAAPHIFNASLSYENKKIVARISGNFTSSYVDDSDDAGYNEDPFFDRYYGKQFFLDANASYAIIPKLRIFVEANNLTNQPLRYYQGTKERTAQLEYYGPRFNMGIKFDLNK